MKPRGLSLPCSPSEQRLAAGRHLWQSRGGGEGGRRLETSAKAELGGAGAWLDLRECGRKERFQGGRSLHCQLQVFSLWTSGDLGPQRPERDRAV